VSWRRCSIAILCLAVGPVLSLIIAWLLSADVSYTEHAGFSVTILDDRNRPDAVYVSKSFGSVFLVKAFGLTYEKRDAIPATLRRQGPRYAWSSIEKSFVEPQDVSGCYISIEQGAGWPCYCVHWYGDNDKTIRGGWSYRLDSRTALYFDHGMNGIVALSFQAASGVLAVRPIAIGMIINSIFYTVITGGMVLAGGRCLRVVKRLAGARDLSDRSPGAPVL